MSSRQLLKLIHLHQQLTELAVVVLKDGDFTFSSRVDYQDPRTAVLTLYFSDLSEFGVFDRCWTIRSTDGDRCTECFEILNGVVNDMTKVRRQLEAKEHGCPKV